MCNIGYEIDIQSDVMAHHTKILKAVRALLKLHFIVSDQKTLRVKTWLF